MIHRIQLRRWRSYTQLDLPLTRPVTFLVAPNGVGKSSLVEAVRWVLLGTPVDRSRGRAVQAGHDDAAVKIWVTLAGHGEAEVSRTLRRDGAASFHATLDGRPLSEAAYLDLLGDVWSAQPALLDAVIFGPTLEPKTTEFPVREHLAAVLGVQPLLQAAAHVKARRDLLATQIRSLRDDSRGTAQAIESARQNIEELDAQAERIRQQRTTAEARRHDLELTAAREAAWQRYREQAAQYRQRTQTLVQQMTAGLGQPADGWGPNPRAALTRARQEAAEAVEANVSAAAESDLRAAQSATAAELLAAASELCPTCLRPLSAAERQAALNTHGHHSQNARSDRVRYQEQTDRARTQLAIIAQFSDAFADLHPPVEPADPDPGPGAETDLGHARAEVNDLAQRHGGVIERLRAAKRQLEELQTAAADQRQLTRLATQDLLLEVTHRSLTATADRYLTERVEPLVTQIAHRWKLLFGADGLRLSPHGQLSVHHADVELTLADLSGGERATALLITRVLLAASTTRASTLWFDEPLEHLDPLRRGGVAQALVRAAQTEAVSQIVITTYEEGLARRLQATAPDAVGLTYVRTTTTDLES